MSKFDKYLCREIPISLHRLKIREVGKRTIDKWRQYINVRFKCKVKVNVLEDYVKR